MRVQSANTALSLAHIRVVGGGVFEITARARLAPDAVLELALPDELSAPDLAARPELAEIFGVPFKPKADLLLSGAAYAPGGRAVPACRVRFSVGAHQRELHVLGDRKGDARGRAIGEPKPFTTMPLGYERAYGGPGYAENPIGRGHVVDGQDGLVDLPNVLDPADVAANRVGRAPAGFGPLSRTWGARRKLGGTYDDRWLRERWPEYPTDLQPGYFNAAPPELQVPYLRGDETIALENLHPEHERLTARLPGLRPRCFLLDRGPQIDLAPGHYDGARFDEVELHLDTLWVDMTTSLVTLVWRGSFAPPSSGDAAQVFLLTEPTSEPPRSADDIRKALLTALAVERPEPVELPEAPAVNDNDVDARADAALKEALAPLREQLVKGGASASVLAAFDSGDMDEMMKRVVAETGIDPAEGEKVVQKSQDDLRKLLKEQGHDLSELEAPPPEPELPVTLTREDVIARHASGVGLAEQILSGLDLSGLDLSGANFHGAFLEGARFAKSRLAGADLGGSILTGVDFGEASLAGAKLAASDLTGAKLAGADLTGADLSSAVIRDADLQGAKMHEVKAPTTMFQRSNLSLATLSEANLAGALLDSCKLDNASFHRANLEGAVIERAEGAAVDFSEANLVKLHAAEGAKLPRANLRGVRSTRSIWAGADLREADMSLSVFDGADLSDVNLERANLHGADLKGANLDRANLARAVATRSRFFRATLVGASLEHADFRDACLYEAELLRSRRDGARFEGADLDRTKIARDAPALPPGV